MLSDDPTKAVTDAVHRARLTWTGGADEEYDRLIAEAALAWLVAWADESPAQTWAGRSGLKERLLHPERFKPDGDRVQH